MQPNFLVLPPAHFIREFHRHPGWRGGGSSELCTVGLINDFDMHLAFIDFAHPRLELDRDPVGQANFRQRAQEKIEKLLPGGWKVTSHTLRDLDVARQADGYYFGGCMTSCHLYEREYLSQVQRLVEDVQKPCLLACGSMQAYCYSRGSPLSMLGLCSRRELDSWPGYMPGAIKINRTESVKLLRPDPFWDYCGRNELSLSEFHCHQVDSPPPQWIHLAASRSCHVEIIRKAWDFAPKLAFQSHPELGMDGGVAISAFLKLWERWQRCEEVQPQLVQLFIDSFTVCPRKKLCEENEAALYLHGLRTTGEVFRTWKGKRLIGFACSRLGKADYRLELLAVDGRLRGNGIEKKLVRRFYHRGRELGYSPDMMTAEARASAFIHLLEVFGFQRESEHAAASGRDAVPEPLWRGDNARCPTTYWEADSRSAVT